MSTRSVLFHSGSVRCEGVVCAPAGEERARCVVTHPHPLYGGSMDNNVVCALCEFLPQAGIGALRFNFRGVGRSGGAFSGGKGEADDLAAAVDFFSQRFAGPVYVAGYSFGAFVAALTAQGNQGFSALALISPPINMMDVRFTVPEKMPLFVMCGDRDLFCPAEELRIALGAACDPVIVAGADHFWSGFEKQMAEAVVAFFAVL
jgi:hypothetical protein